MKISYVRLDCDIYITGSRCTFSPYLANIRYEEDSARLYLHDFFNSVQLKDIVKHDKMRDVDLFYQVKREDLQGKQILSSNEKYYIADHGIREAVFGGNMRNIRDFLLQEEWN